MCALSTVTPSLAHCTKGNSVSIVQIPHFGMSSVNAGSVNKTRNRSLAALASSPGRMADCTIALRPNGSMCPVEDGSRSDPTENKVHWEGSLLKIELDSCCAIGNNYVERRLIL